MKMNEKYMFIMTFALALISLYCYNFSSHSFLKEIEPEATITQKNTVKVSEPTTSLKSVEKVKKSKEKDRNDIILEQNSITEQTGPVCKGDKIKVSNNSGSKDRLYQGMALCKGNWQLVVQDDGNVVLRNKSGFVIWSSGQTSSSNLKKYLELSKYGYMKTFVEENPKPVEYWNQSLRFDIGNYALELTKEGNLHMKSQNSTVWSLFERSSLISDAKDNIETCRINSKEGIASGKYLLFNDPNGFLRFLENGNEKWNIPLNGSDPVAVLQSDGNFVAYTTKGATWSSETSNSKTTPPYSLLIDDNKGQIVIKDKNNLELLRK